MVDRYDQYLDKLHKLASGELDPLEISRWAINEEIEVEANNQKLTQYEEEMLDNLQLAGTLNEKGECLYVKEDFEDWYSEARNVQ